MALTRKDIEQHLLQALSSFMQDLSCVVPTRLRPLMITGSARMQREATRKQGPSPSASAALVRMLPLCTLDLHNGDGTEAIKQVDALLVQGLGIQHLGVHEFGVHELYAAAGSENQAAILEHLRGLQMLCKLLDEHVPEEQRMQSAVSVLQGLSKGQQEMVQQMALHMLSQGQPPSFNL